MAGMRYLGDLWNRNLRNHESAVPRKNMYVIPACLHVLLQLKPSTAWSHDHGCLIHMDFTVKSIFNLIKNHGVVVGEIWE